jgi:hypothetical protein
VCIWIYVRYVLKWNSSNCIIFVVSSLTVHSATVSIFLADLKSTYTYIHIMFVFYIVGKNICVCCFTMGFFYVIMEKCDMGIFRFQVNILKLYHCLYCTSALLQDVMVSQPELLAKNCYMPLLVKSPRAWPM